MEARTKLKKIVEELNTGIDSIKEEEIQSFTKQILETDRIFIAGAGRSGFVARAFANRLMHLGKKVYFVGEPTTPAIRDIDLLVIGSGSGETESLKVMAQRAKKIGAAIATITIFPQGSIGKLADLIVQIPGATPKGKLENAYTSIQPMGNLFEQLSWLVYDSVIMLLMEKLNLTEEQMFQLHANLE